MRGYDLMKRFEALSESQRKYCIQWFTGAVGCTAEGFTRPHKDKPHADWALNEFERAIDESKKKVVDEI